jgi:hypothetical protein
MSTKLLLGAVVLGLSSLVFPAAAAAQTKGPAMVYPSPEMAGPISWSSLSKYLAEKAPLTDPIAEQSKKAAMASSVVIQSAPAAYLKMSVPDPFENRNVLRMPSVIPEEPMPPLLLPKK